jgi:predicted N-acetyltransferase YhbS
MTFEIRKATESDSPGIRDLFARTFDRVMTAEEWAWKYPGNPDGWIAFVAEQDDRIVGHYGGWPARATIGGAETTVVSVGDVATERTVRHLGGRRNVFRCMAEEMFAHLRAAGIPFVFGFPNTRAFEVGKRFLGYRAELSIREVMYEIPPSPSGGMEREWAGASEDALWRKARAELRAGFVRDRPRVDWRYRARPDRRYRFVKLAEPGGKESACGVLSLRGENALVVDALVGRDHVVGLFGALAKEAAAMGARHLVFWQTFAGPLAAVAGNDAQRQLPGARVAEAGFSFATVPFDSAATAEFVRNAPITAGIYDDR